MEIIVQSTTISGFIRIRLFSLWRRKVALTVGISFLFWATYYLLMYHPVLPVTIFEPSSIDLFVPFLPDTIYIYLSLFLLNPLAPWLMDSKRELHVCCACLLVIIIVALFIFFIWPTSCPQLSRSISGNPLYNFTADFDKQLNNLPSVHAAVTIYSCLVTNYVLQVIDKSYLLRSSVTVWAGILLLSILTTKFHTLIDLLGGVVLGIFGYIIFKSLNSRETS